MNYLLIYFSAIILTFSIIGYGFLLSRIVDKNLLTLNIGYQGLLGIFFLTIISYFTIFFVKHGYIHNIILHFIGILSFFNYLKSNNRTSEIIRLIILFSILFIALLIIRHHDDFNYYHLTYSLGLTENKLFLGLGHFSHGYKHHSSLFFFNSIIFLPYIKYYLFHSLGWFTLLFVNYFILDFLFFKKIKVLDFEYFFYLMSLMFINIKFSRIGGYGTDLSAQIILLSILPLIYSTLRMKISNKDFKSNLSLIIFLITYSATVKSFFILNIVFLISFLFFFNYKKILHYFIFSKAFLISSLTIMLLILINISYTGCAVYPVKQTCLSNQLSWSLEKKLVGKMNNWYELWAKSGVGVYKGDPEKFKKREVYIQKFNWVGNWYDKYFLYKGKETVQGLLILIFLNLILFRGIRKEKPDKKKINFILMLFGITSILFFEWFYNHPAFRYGGYYLLCILFFIPISYYLGTKKHTYINKKNTIICLIIFSFFVFYVRNIKRINEEIIIVSDNNFPLFYAPIQTYEEINLDYNVNVYKPTSKQGCWVTKTPCVSNTSHIFVKEKLGFKIFVAKNKVQKNN